jgi:hypothetical protein
MWRNIQLLKELKSYLLLSFYKHLTPDGVKQNRPYLATTDYLSKGLRVFSCDLVDRISLVHDINDPRIHTKLHERKTGQISLRI